MLVWYSDAARTHANTFGNSGKVGHRTRERRADHVQSDGYCQLCFQREMIEMLVDETPEMCRAGAEDVVSEWILSEADLDH